jgi:hypothetical protein
MENQPNGCGTIYHWNNLGYVLAQNGYKGYLPHHNWGIMCVTQTFPFMMHTLYKLVRVSHSPFVNLVGVCQDYLLGVISVM